MSKDKPKRRNYMTAAQHESMGDLPRTHQNCFEKTGVCRPGKTRHERARGSWISNEMRRKNNEQKNSGKKF